MESYSVYYGEMKYRVVEKKTLSGKSVFFLQKSNSGYKHYKSRFIFWSEEKPYKSELIWTYVLKSEAPFGSQNNEPYKHIYTAWNGEIKDVDIEEYIERGCKSIDEAKVLMEEHKAYLEKLNKEKNDKIFDKEQEDKLIPLNYEENNVTVNS